MFEHFDAVKVRCDRCGNYYGGDGYAELWFNDESDAEWSAGDSEWQKIGGKIYCPDCYEYDGETDEYKVKEGE